MGIFLLIYIKAFHAGNNESVAIENHDKHWKLLKKTSARTLAGLV